MAVTHADNQCVAHDFNHSTRVSRQAFHVYTNKAWLTSTQIPL